MKTRKVTAKDRKAAQRAVDAGLKKLADLVEEALDTHAAGFETSHIETKIADASRELESAKSHLRSVSAPGARLIVR